MMAVTVLSDHQQAATMSLFHNFKLKMKKAQSSSSLSRCSIKAEAALESLDRSHIENSSNSDSPDSGMSSASESGSSGISVTSPPISSPPESPPEHNLFKRERSPPVISPVKTEILKAHLKREQSRAMDWSISPKSGRMNQVNLSCERRSPDSPSERSFKIECTRTPSPIIYDGEEHHITSTPMGLGAGPSCERMSASPPPNSLSPINDSNDHQTQLHNLSVHLHSSSISANPYNMAPSVSASAAIFPVNGFGSNPKQLLVNNGYSNGIETSPNIFEYHKTVSHARINGIMPELIRGGEIKTTDGKTNVKCHNNTTNQVVLGEAGGFKSMLWVEDNKPREKLGASEPPKTNGNGPNWNSQSSSSAALNPNQRASDSVFGNSMISNGVSVSPVLMRNETDRQSHHSISPVQSENTSNFAAQNGGRPLPISMEELWEWNGLVQSNPPEVARRPNMPPDPAEKNGHHSDEEDKPLICMICDDSATGLHYGIITCEGCKGFFKRTVQNKRIYNCVADGNCEINKQQRNRCQYCRFQKCLRQGMVLAAVREDRMPGGRNSGAVYNLYKVKYKKKNKNKQKDINKQQNGYPDRGPCSSTSMGHNGTIYPKDMSQHMMDHSMSPQQHYKAPSPASVAAAASSLASLAHHRTSPTSSSSLNLSPLHASALNTAMTLHQVMVSLPNASPTSTIANNRSAGLSFTPGNILKAALTNPSEVAHFRQCSKKLPSPPPVVVNKICSYSDAQNAIRELRHYDRFQDCALMKLLPEFDKPEDLSTNHDRRNPLIYEEPQENPESFFADKVACNHMQWIRHLPFGDESADHLLTSSCFGLVIFNAVFYLHNKNSHRLTVQHSSESYNNQINIEMSANIAALKKGLQEMSITNGRADNLLQRWIPITEKLSEFTVYLNAARLEESEFLLLKVIMYTMKATPEMTGIMEVNRMFKNFLDVYCRVHNQNQPKRVAELLKKTAEILEVSHDLLLEDTSRLKAPFFICDNR